MTKNENAYHVAIVGGGPVGLFLACCLHHEGISCTVLEKRRQPITHSRSIGIHPVSLSLFNQLGFADVFISAGVKVEEGLAFYNEEKIATLSFENCPPPFPFILTLPQYKTERILADHLKHLDSKILQRGAHVKSIRNLENGVQLAVKNNDKEQLISADFVAGCDGINSFVRRSAGITFTGRIYDDVYIMGDFSDNTALGSNAGIFICDEGLIESFPLTPYVRRWVVKTQHFINQPTRKDIESRIARRISLDLSSTENLMRSGFGVQEKFAQPMAKDRVLLAGDAAHVISPIGGQGMNLGWLDARDLAQCLGRIIWQEIDKNKVLESYSKRRLHIAKKTARRAAFNMAMGRKEAPNFKKVLLRTLLKTPAKYLMARLFTMHGLHTYFI